MTDLSPVDQGAPALLDIDNLTIQFGGLRAVSDFTMGVPEHGLYGLIGPNGAGKTTVFNMITGLYVPTSGEVRFDGQTLNGLQPHSITHLGIARTFQNIRLFRNLTVLDNVRIAYHQHAGYGLLEAVSRLGRFRREERLLTERAQDSLACTTDSSSWPRTCPMASSAASRSPARWLPSRDCYCSTSQPPA